MNNLPEVKMRMVISFDKIDIPFNQLALFIGPLNITLDDGKSINIDFDYYQVNFSKSADNSRVFAHIEGLSSDTDLHLAEHYIHEYEEVGVDIKDLNWEKLWSLKSINSLQCICKDIHGNYIDLENFLLGDLAFSDGYEGGALGADTLTEFNKKYREHPDIVNMEA